MSCFCHSNIGSLGMLLPQVDLSVSAAPWQMPHMVALLGLSAGDFGSGERSDLSLSAALPNMSAQAWLSTHLNMPMPFGGPPLISMMARLSLMAGQFPMTSMSGLLSFLQSALKGLAYQMIPFSAQAMSIPQIQLTNIVGAARLTLALRGLGLCPLALASVDMSFSESLGLGDPHATLNAAISASLSMTGPTIPRFGLSFDQMNLALTMAAYGALADPPPTLGVPPITDPNFSAMAMNALAGLMDFPPISLDPTQLFAELARLSDLAAIQQAFGDDAMTSAGVSRIQMMLNYMMRLSLPPLPSLMLGLQAKLDMLPALDDVLAGMDTAQSGAASFSASMSFNPSLPPIIPLLEAINALQLVLDDAIGPAPAGLCPRCGLVN